MASKIQLEFCEYNRSGNRGSMKKVLVTGGAGFLGSHLCEELVSQGDFVYCLDNLYTGSLNNISHLQNTDNFEFIQHDIIDPISLTVNEIYNLACPASPVHYQADPVRTVRTNVQGSINMLNLAVENSAKILQASTSEVYGDPEVHPQSEDYWGKVNPIGIRSCYDEGKRCAETLFFDYHRQYGVRIKVARIFNTYGPRMHPNDGRVVSNFIVQLLTNNEITIYGDGSQTRSFCYVDDLIVGLVALMRTSDQTTGPINIGNPTEFSINELANEIIKLTGKSSKISFHDLPSDDPKQRKPEITKAIELLNWNPVTSLEQGLNKTISYFENLLTS